MCTARILPHLFFEPARERLLDIFRLKLDELARGMEAFVLNCPLTGRGLVGMSRVGVHSFLLLDASPSRLKSVDSSAVKEYPFPTLHAELLG